MAAIPYDVAYAFTEGRAARRGAFQSTGDALYSYALKLAHWSEDGQTIIVDTDLEDAPSVTTARHMNATRYVLHSFADTMRIEYP